MCYFQNFLLLTRKMLNFDFTETASVVECYNMYFNIVNICLFFMCHMQPYFCPTPETLIDVCAHKFVNDKGPTNYIWIIYNVCCFNSYFEQIFKTPFLLLITWILSFWKCYAYIFLQKGLWTLRSLKGYHIFIFT